MTTASTQTVIPQATHHSEHATCGHGQDILGYVVAYSRFDSATNTTTFEDIEYVHGSTNYGDALDIVHAARDLVMSGKVEATYAVIHTVYEGNHRLF